MILVALSNMRVVLLDSKLKLVRSIISVISYCQQMFHVAGDTQFLPRDAILSAVYTVVVCLSVRPSVFVCVSVTLRYCITSGSAMAEGARDALVSRNSATTKHPI